VDTGPAGSSAAEPEIRSMSARMTPRQRWLTLLEGGVPDRLPTDYWATAEFTSRLKSDLGLNSEDDEGLWRRLQIDRPRGVWPECRRPNHPDDPLANQWGIRHRAIDYGTGSYLEADTHPLAQVRSVNDVHRFRWPDPDEFDYSTIGESLRHDHTYRVIQAGHYEPFLLYCAMRGMEQAYEDLVLNPEIAAAALERIFDFHYEYNRRIFEAGAGRIDVMYLAEDLGGQTGPLFSLDLYRRFLLSNQTRMAELARSYGVHIIYHTDGAARLFLPDLVNRVGIEMLNPIQWRCPGMEIDGLVRDFGQAVVFHGSIDNQRTLPFGTVDDVVAEVRTNARLFRRARWICAPCHNIQAVTPTRNVIAMYEAANDIRLAA
jgi:uroporphyrinogen decarboxylase